MKRCVPETGEIYHIYNRGVDKRIVFTNSKEYSYFIHLLYALNNTKNANNTARNYENEDGRDRISTISAEKREPLVDILAFVLMPNHYHLLLKQVTDDGISKFMQKIGIGYTMLFNKKYKRSGSLFQGKYKSVDISSNRQLLYIPHYIHLNPISLFKDDENENNVNTTLDKLKLYKWSSFPDYCNMRNFPSVTEREFILSLFGNSNKYVDDIKQFINGKDSFINVNTSELIDN